MNAKGDGCGGFPVFHSRTLKFTEEERRGKFYYDLVKLSLGLLSQ